MTSAEMTERLAHLNAENEKMSRKLEELRTGGRKVDPAEKAALDIKHEKLTKAFKARKKLVLTYTYFAVYNELSVTKFLGRYQRAWARNQRCSWRSWALNKILYK